MLEKILETLKEQGVRLPAGNISIGGFGDSEALSTELISLILAGTKRGTCSLLWSWEFDGETPPVAGDLEIVLDYADRPVLIRRTTHVAIIPFNSVSADFAASEGEGDLSLDYWRREHWQFFSRECTRIGREIDEAMPLVCETFEVLDVFGLPGAQHV